MDKQNETECSEERTCVSCFSDDGACLAEQQPEQSGLVEAENERLRGLLTTLRVSLNLDDTEYGLSQQEKRKLAADIDAELSRQPETMCETMQRPKAECGCPDCGSSLIDWPTAAEQGFMDGQPAEAEGVDRYYFDQTGCDVKDSEGPWVSHDDHLDALSAVTAERNAFRESRNCLVEENTLLYEQIADLIGERDQLLAKVEATHK